MELEKEIKYKAFKKEFLELCDKYGAQLRSELLISPPFFKKFFKWYFSIFSKFMKTESHTFIAEKTNE